MEGGFRAVRILRPWGQKLVQDWVGKSGTLYIMMASLDRSMMLNMLYWVKVLVKD